MDRLRVVIADDSASYRRLLARVLATTDDFAVVGEAADGVEAVELVRGRQPDVVLMDFAMPRMDGLSAAKAIQAEWPDVRVFMLTAVPDLVDAAELLRAGIRPLLAKDLPAPTIIAAIRAELRGTRIASDTPPTPAAQTDARQRRPPQRRG